VWFDARADQEGRETGGPVSIRAKAPLRVSFAGGGTDVAPFPEREGGMVLSATIDRYAYGSLTARTDGRVRVESVDLARSVEFAVGPAAARALEFNGELDLAKAVLRRFGFQGSDGFDVLLRSTVPPGSGLGSSSTVAAVLVGLIRDHYGLGLTEYETAHLAFEIERLDLGISGGLQDHYAAVFGGFNFIEFGNGVIVNTLRIPDAVVNELELNLLLADTGVTRESARILDDQTTRVKEKNPDTLAALRAQKDLVLQMKAALLRGRLHDFGALLDDAWRQKRRMSPRIATAHIDEVYAEAVKHGARGGKVTGAGGGGYILFYCDFSSKHLVVEALAAMGVAATDVAFTRKGLTTWRT
jgi:D-glycero-alpha-D-manno-heptose-7-phosphate kinase